MPIAPSEHVQSHAWTASLSSEPKRWCISLSTQISEELIVLSKGIKLKKTQATSVHFMELIIKIKKQLQDTGVSLIQGLSGLDEHSIRNVYLMIGEALGKPIETYGLLYDVIDQGRSYLERVPVSQTKATTKMHTDSSQRSVHPHLVGLTCIRPALIGGGSRLASAAHAHEMLRYRFPTLLKQLYQPFVRDLVTPGSQPSHEALNANRFPIFAYQGQLTLRYMRYWIERGHARIGEPLHAKSIEAFDALDELLNDPQNQLRFTMTSGDMLFIDNTLVTHDREAFEDDPMHKRLMVRLWLNDLEEINDIKSLRT